MAIGESLTSSKSTQLPRSSLPPGPFGSNGGPKFPMSSRNEKKARTLGLTSATGLVVGSIVGTGVFTMPAVLAGAGTMSLAVLGVIAVGALLLGVLFGQLTRRVPNSDGGLYAYSRHEFGDFAGYLVGWSYWISMPTPCRSSPTSPMSSSDSVPRWPARSGAPHPKPCAPRCSRPGRWAPRSRPPAASWRPPENLR